MSRVSCFPAPRRDRAADVHRHRHARLVGLAGRDHHQPARRISDPTTVDITGTFPAAYSGIITVTATDATAADTGTATFNWTATNTVALPSPGNQSSTVGVALNLPIQPATDSGGAAVTYAIAGQPAGLVIDATTGAITGIPTTVGTFNTTITATDATGASGTGVITWTVQNKVTVSPVTAQKTRVGTPFTLRLSATGSDATKTTFTWKAATPLPAGLKVNAATGVISGTPAGYATVTSKIRACPASSRSVACAWHCPA